MLGIVSTSYRYETLSASKSIIQFDFQSIKLTAGWAPGIGINRISFTNIEPGVSSNRPPIRFTKEEAQSRLMRLAKVLDMPETLEDLEWTQDDLLPHNLFFTLTNPIPGTSCSNGMGLTGNFSLHTGFPSTAGVRTTPVDFEPLIGLARNTDELRSSVIGAYLQKSEDQGFELHDVGQSLGYVPSPATEFPQSARHLRLKEQQRALITQAFHVVPGGSRGENGELTMIVTFIVDVQTGEVLRAEANYSGAKASRKKASLAVENPVHFGPDGPAFRLQPVKGEKLIPERRVAVRQNNLYFAARLAADRRLLVINGDWYRIPSSVPVP